MKETLLKIFKNETFVAVLLILFTTLITYGISIPRLGYYYDDWYLLWSGEVRGPGSLISLFSIDRPFMGVVYSVIYRLLGARIINWHLYALLWRFIGGAAFFWILRLVWPENRRLTAMMAVLFVVYPGFLSQPDAATKQNHLYGFGTALLSIAFMLQGVRSSRMVWKILHGLVSVILAANYLFIYEYMIGLEGMRLVLLGYVVFQDAFRGFWQFAWEVLKKWWPYPLAAAVFLGWRLFFFEGARAATDVSNLFSGYLDNLRHMLVRLFFETAKDFLDASVFAWFVKPYLLFSQAAYSSLGKALLIAALVVVLVWGYTCLHRRWWGTTTREDETAGLAKSFLWIGAAVTLFAVFPVILSGRQLDLFDAYKSYGLHPIGGVVLFVSGILLLFQPRVRQTVLIVLVALSVSTQILNADFWADHWKTQRETWWQLSWRAPDIRDDTVVVAYFPSGYRLQQDYEIFGPVGLIYRPGPADSPAIQAEVLNRDTVFDILTGEVRMNAVRDIRMKRDFRNLLLVSIPSTSSCMSIIDGALPVYSQWEDLIVKQVGEYSSLERVIPSGPSHTPPSEIFGPEPPHGWCYYYQKASLARQVGDWEQVGRIYDQVQAQGLEPADEVEMIPFVEGLVNIGRDEDARQVYQQWIKGRQKLRLPLCTRLEQDPGYPPGFNYDYEKINEILCGQ
ncbi:MAG: hypothetical protein JXA13_03300 [Anaerolineales bacterium]|nr:hypothetical protein [Anaerolineales bacterium]